MTLTWGTPANDTSDGNILNYLISCTSNGDGNFGLTLTRPAASDRVVMLDSLLPYVSYNCCVAVQTDSGVSPFSCLQQFTLEEGKTLTKLCGPLHIISLPQHQVILHRMWSSTITTPLA